MQTTLAETPKAEPRTGTLLLIDLTRTKRQWDVTGQLINACSGCGAPILPPENRVVINQDAGKKQSSHSFHRECWDNRNMQL